MNSLITSNTKTPEQEELEEKYRILEDLEANFASTQVDYSTLAGEIAAFRNRYYLRVGSLYARLDSLRAEIRKLVAQQHPGNETAHKEAEQAYQQAQATADEVNCATEDGPVDFQPSTELKHLYRQAAKLIHPDRAKDDEDRQLRDRLMAEVNAAYAAGDAEAISEILERYRDRLNAADRDDVGAQLVRAIRNIARTRTHIASLEQAIASLKISEWYKLKIEVTEGEARGEDMLGQLAEKIHADILEEQKHLNQLLSISPTDLNNALHCTAAQTSETAAQPAQFRPEGLIHRTERGEKVRSKSETIIANILHNLGLDYRYEYPIEGHARMGIRRPDFVFFDASKQPLLWEHLGMLDDPDYRARWETKRGWYEANGFTEGNNLFITRDESDGGLDSQQIRKTAESIRARLMP